MSTETLPASATTKGKRARNGQEQPPDTRPGTAVTPPKLRRRPIMVAAGIAAVSLGALLSVWAYTSSSDTQSVIAVRETINRGELIEEKDLMAVNVSLDPALRPVAAADASSQVIGKRAALDLAAGGVVTSEQVTDTLLPPADQSIVGVSLSPAMLPANQVKMGDVIRVVEVPGPQAASSAEEDSGPVRTVDGTVVGIHTDAAGGNTVVNILVPAQDAPEVATWSAGARAALVVDSTEQ